MPKNDVAFQVRLPSELHTEFKNAAKWAGVSESELARRLFREETEKMRAVIRSMKKSVRGA